MATALRTAQQPGTLSECFDTKSLDAFESFGTLPDMPDSEELSAEVTQQKTT